MKIGACEDRKRGGRGKTLTQRSKVLEPMGCNVYAMKTDNPAISVTLCEESWWVCPERATIGNRPAALRDGIHQMRSQIQNARACRSMTGDIPVCSISNRHLAGRDDLRIGHRAWPIGSIPLQESCVEGQHVGRRVPNFKDAIQ